MVGGVQHPGPVWGAGTSGSWLLGVPEPLVLGLLPSTVSFGGAGAPGWWGWGCLGALVWGVQHPGSVWGAGTSGSWLLGVPEPLVLGLSPSTVNLWVWDTWVVGFGVPEPLGLGLIALHDQFRGLGHLGGGFGGACAPWFWGYCLPRSVWGSGTPGSWLLGVPECLGLG